MPPFGRRRQVDQVKNGGFLSGEVSIRPEIQSELASVWHLPSQDSCVDQADSRTDRQAADMGMLAGQTKDRRNGDAV
jgi:hypothetical protein